MRFLVHLVVTALIMLAIARLPLGIEVSSFGVAIIAALVFGVVNALIRPIVSAFSLPVTILTFGLFSLVINAAMFGLAAWLVSGFEVNGFWSAFFGALVLSIVQAIVYAIIPGDDSPRVGATT